MEGWAEKGEQALAALAALAEMEAEAVPVLLEPGGLPTSSCVLAVAVAVAAAAAEVDAEGAAMVETAVDEEEGGKAVEPVGAEEGEKVGEAAAHQTQAVLKSVMEAHASQRAVDWDATKGDVSVEASRLHTYRFRGGWRPGLCEGREFSTTSCRGTFCVRDDALTGLGGDGGGG
jgi:hypothetical protein